MEVSKVNKIVVVSFCDGFSKEIGDRLSQCLGMIFCDAKDLVEYELVNRKAMEVFCTKKYLKESEKKVFKQIASFENVVVSISYDYLVHNIDAFSKNSVIVFVKLPKKFVKENSCAINQIVFEERTAELEKLSSIVVETRKTETNFVCEKIINEIGGIL